MPEKKIFILGYLGYYNFGDDLLLNVLIKNLNYNNIVVLTKKNYYGLNAVNRYNIFQILKVLRAGDILINLGGIFQDSTSIKSFFYYFIINVIFLLKKAKIFLINIDAVDIKYKINLSLLKYLLKKSRAAVFRDKESYNKFKNFQNAEYIPDLSLIEFAGKSIKKRKSYILISPINKKQIVSISGDEILLINKEEYKRYNFDNVLVYNYSNINEVINKILSAKKIVSARYHIILIALQNNVPVKILSGYKKLEELKEKNKKNIDKKKKSLYNIKEIRRKWKKVFMKIEKELA